MAKKREVLFLELDAHIRVMLPERTLMAALKLRDELATRFFMPLEFSRWRALMPNGARQFHTFPPFAPDGNSMHQKMEAALLWRDFVARSSNRREVEAALRELTG